MWHAVPGWDTPGRWSGRGGGKRCPTTSSTSPSPGWSTAHGYRHAYLGDVPAPVVYGVQGTLREYYGVAEGPPVASTLDHIVAAVAG